MGKDGSPRACSSRNDAEIVCLFFSGHICVNLSHDACNWNAV